MQYPGVPDFCFNTTCVDGGMLIWVAWGTCMGNPNCGNSGQSEKKEPSPCRGRSSIAWGPPRRGVRRATLGQRNIGCQGARFLRSRTSCPHTHSCNTTEGGGWYEKNIHNPPHGRLETSLSHFLTTVACCRQKPGENGD